MSSCVQCVWISWRIQCPFPVDTVTVRAVLQAAGIRRIRRESTAALSGHMNSSWETLASPIYCMNTETKTHNSSTEGEAQQKEKRGVLAVDVGGLNFTHITQTQNQETGNTCSEKEKMKCSWAVVCLCLCIQAVKWQKPEFLRMSSCVQCVWISWRIQWPFPVDTVTVRAVLQAAGIRRIRWESTAALSADRPSVQDLL